MNKSRAFRLFSAGILTVLTIGLILGGSWAAAQLTNSNVEAASLTPTPTPTSGPTPPPIPTPAPIDISGSIAGNGTVQQDIVYSVLGGQAVLNIASGTTALTDTGGPLQSITVGGRMLQQTPGTSGSLYHRLRL